MTLRLEVCPGSARKQAKARGHGPFPRTRQRTIRRAATPNLATRGRGHARTCGSRGLVKKLKTPVLQRKSLHCQTLPILQCSSGYLRSSDSCCFNKKSLFVLGPTDEHMFSDRLRSQKTAGCTGFDNTTCQRGPGMICRLFCKRCKKKDGKSAFS